MSDPTAITSAPSLQLVSEGDLVRAVLSQDYEILEELGRGGMAIVYRAREKALDREVAIKVLPSRLAIDGGFVERFEHEARTAAKLEHPNIVPIYRVGRAGPNGEVAYFVMKLLRGQSLSAVLAERGKLEPSDLRRILMETASALGYAAKRGVVHRDIKPDNIMLDGEGRCVVTDFGIAKAPGGQNTTAGTSLGTPRYMSPEHAIGSALDGRSDMYSLGIVAYQCLTGQPPYSADEPFALLYKHIHDPLPQPTLTTDAERDLFVIVARMLAKNPDDRFQSGYDLIVALGGTVSDPSLVSGFTTNPGLMAPTEVIPTPKPWTMQRWHRFTRMEKRLSILLVAAIAVSVINFTVDRQPQADANPGVPTSAPVKTVATAPGAAKVGDSTYVPAAATPPAPTGPSKRAAAILTYNKSTSNCPKRDTLPDSRRIAYAVLMDSIADRKPSPSMVIPYDVCGLDRGTEISAHFKVTSIGRFKSSTELEGTRQEYVGSPRSRQRLALDVGKLRGGKYQLDMIVKTKGNAPVSFSRGFKITDK